MNIIKKPSNNFGERNEYKPDVIVIHISAGTDKSMSDWFQNPSSQASSHYGVDLQDGTIYQYVDESKKAWTCGNVRTPTSEIVKSRPGINPNLYTINIENEGLDFAKATEIQILSLCELIKDIASRWNIPLDRKHIIGHYEIDSIQRPNCPSPDHTVIDRLIMPRLIADEQVCLKVPKSKLEIINKFLSNLK